MALASAVTRTLQRKFICCSDQDPCMPCQINPVPGRMPRSLLGMTRALSAWLVPLSTLTCSEFRAGLRAPSIQLTLPCTPAVFRIPRFVLYCCDLAEALSNLSAYTAIYLVVGYVHRDRTFSRTGIRGHRFWIMLNTRCPGNILRIIRRPDPTHPLTHLCWCTRSHGVAYGLLSLR
jgi:hypothetical protein